MVAWAEAMGIESVVIDEYRYQNIKRIIKME